MRTSSAVSKLIQQMHNATKRNYVQRVVESDKQHVQPSPKSLISNIGMVNDNMVMGVTTMVGGCHCTKANNTL